MARVLFADKCQRFNIEPALKYGEAVFAFEGTLFPLDIDGMAAIFARALDNFDWEEDVICMTGHANCVAVLLAMAATRFDRINVLVFDAKTGEYWFRTLNNGRATHARKD